MIFLAGVAAAALFIGEFDRSCHEHKPRCSPPLVRVERKVGTKVWHGIKHVIKKEKTR